MKQRKITILLADDHALMRMGLRSLISFQPDMEVVGEAEDGEEAVSAALALSPDVVIMDLMMPRTDGVEATRRILAERPETKVVILTSYGTSAALSRALASGAVGAQMKETPTDELLAAIRKVCKGERAIAPEIAEYLAAEPAPPDLTDLQADVLRSIMRGQSNQDIALQLGISPETVKKHLNAIFAKLGAATRAEAVAIALRKHLLNI